MSVFHYSPGGKPRPGGGPPRGRADFAVPIGKNDPQPEWRRMVVFPDDGGAVCAAVISLYRKAWRAAGAPKAARLYVRDVAGAHLIYFSPAAARLSEKIFEVFPADRIPAAPDPEYCSIVKFGR